MLRDLQQMLLELPQLLLGLLRMERCKLLISSQFLCHKTGGQFRGTRGLGIACLLRLTCRPHRSRVQASWLEKPI